ncbi:uncharacterized protein LOC110606964 isoform X3 [Manihot esculenta]|uniref:uncharacterized protein LOC110606964 isoform X3 n=1 Tax=Manihot esculenta TaxID=3983 RepID=UPI000B5D1918|nr:uncharacterized protein LOC110606964 isoform X3 [Manihot esculenta]
MVKKEVTPGSRKSARISAMEEKARMLAIQKQTKDEAICGGDASITSSSSATAKMGGRKCRSLQEFVTNCVTTSPHQEGETKSEDNASKAEQMENLPSLQGMPSKLTLEVVLDMLQGETHEIFAQPVDPQEVVGYGNIIREPMDFGTMRAKLQEGMYKSLEQFEHDVFLISSNAMKFNSSTTVYYKEARALSKLAQSVFHFLRTNPENFQLGFSRTRRHPGRKPQSEAGGSHSRSAKLANSKDGVSLDDPSIQRTAVSLPQFKPYIGQTNVGNFPAESRDGTMLNSSETDRHMTYKSQNSFCWENEKLVSTVYNAPKPTPHVSNAGSKHPESLLNFIRNLGAEAQSAANKKLEKCPAEPPKILSWTPKAPKRPFGETADIRLPSPALRKSAAYLNQVNGGQMPYNIISGPPGSYKGKMVCANGGINISGRQLNLQNSLSGPRPQTTDGGLTDYNVVGGQGPNKSGITNAYGSYRSSDNMDLLATLTQFSGIQTQVNHNPSGTNKVTTGSSSSIAAPAFALNQNKLMERKQPAESWDLPTISYLPALQTEAAKQIPPAQNVVLQQQVASTEVKTMNFVGGAKPEGDQAEAIAQGFWNALRSSATDNKKQPDLNLQL